MSDYFSFLSEGLAKEYELAKKARARGIDPKTNVEIPLANDTASRVEGLVSTLKPELAGSGLTQRLRELEGKYGKGDDRICFDIAGEIATGKFCPLANVEEKIEFGVRVALAYMTMGIVTAPLEGLSGVEVKARRDGKEYLAVYFAGPIRSAGGTATAQTVMIADYLRRQFNLSSYDPDENEVERYVIELDDYHNRVTNLQYKPEPDEIRFLIKNCPVEVSGDPTEKMEVLSFKDLPRVETNRIRGGMCLGVSMMGLKAPKLIKRATKFGEDYSLSDWHFLEEYEELKKKLHSTAKKDESGPRVKPNTTFINEIPGGRPVFAYPSAAGGFRLRYGRSRNTGHAAVGIHPVTMYLLDEFIAIGTQIKLERPGKAGAVAPVDTIEGPLIRLKSGDVVRVQDMKTAQELRPKTDKILFLGDILISYGEFLTNGKMLVPGAWCEEWWLREVEKAGSGVEGITALRWAQICSDPFSVTADEAILVSEKLKVPLHPKYTYHYHDLSLEELKQLRRYLKSGENVAGKLTLPKGSQKYLLEKIGVEHWVEGDRYVIKSPRPMLLSLGVGSTLEPDAETVSDYILALSPFQINNRAPVYIGARMGRPEKSERRLMRGRPQVLFPVGRAGGKMRNLVEAAKKPYAAKLAANVCEKCKKKTYYLKCPDCGADTKATRTCVKCGRPTDSSVHCGLSTSTNANVTIKLDLEKMSKELGIKLPEMVKGVKGMSSETKIPERPEKGILRAHHDLYVNKDGTCRLDATDMPMTHFRPSEIGVPVQTLRKLGYDKDAEGKALKSPQQLVELLPQDIIISDYSDASTPSGVDYLLDVGRFMDELLTKVYGLEPFYNFKNKLDIVGTLVVGLAPHTSAGILGRIIGFTPARSCFANPYWHAAKRRNSDGDEDSVMLLLDALINFSREYLPNTRGAKTMDACLVLTSQLKISEVDDEVHDMDVVERYPLELYYAARDCKMPWDVKIKTLAGTIGTDEEYHAKYTTPNNNVNLGPLITAYKSLGPMLDKVRAQLQLAERVRAVDEDNVATVVVTSHFLKDIKGNLRTFCRQSFRCVDCNAKYRRIPLVGKCIDCGGKLVMTVHRGTVEKYLTPSVEICDSYKVPNYVRQQLSLLRRRIDTMFGKEKETQSALSSFL